MRRGRGPFSSLCFGSFFAHTAAKQNTLSFAKNFSSLVATRTESSSDLRCGWCCQRSRLLATSHTLLPSFVASFLVKNRASSCKKDGGGGTILYVLVVDVESLLVAWQELLLQLFYKKHGGAFGGLRSIDRSFLVSRRS
jgi:hypothetical protein